MEIETIKTIWAEDELKQNTHIIVAGNGCIVVDAGCPLEKINTVSNKPIKAVFITHGHYDHIKYIEQFDKLNIPIYASNHISKLLNSAELNVSTIFDKPTTYKVKNLNFVEDNQEITTLGVTIKCIYTPGHSIDSMCYLLNNEILFSGDTLFSVAIGRTDLPTANENDMLNSLNKLNNLKYKHLYTGHGRSSNKEEQNINIPLWISLLEMQNKEEG